MIETPRRGSGPAWAVRIGIHCGPVVAGIMGRRQYSFDLWGDTVNTAARVTSACGRRIDPDECHGLGPGSALLHGPKSRTSGA